MRQIDQAVEVIRAGGIAAIPTDTLYGLAAHALDAAAVQKVFDAKGRPEGMPLPLLLADSDDLAQCCGAVPDAALALAEAFWPGPLSIALPRADAVPDAVTAGGDTVAVRVPGHPVPREIARRLEAPITGTSANRSGHPPATTAHAVRQQLGVSIDCVIDGGAAPIGAPSTIIDLTTQPTPTIVRPGAISRDAIAHVLGAPVAAAPRA